MSTERIRWGILSTAGIAHRAVGPGIHKARNGVLGAVASRSLERARGFAADLEIPTAYGSYAELLADPEIDAVYIPLPTSLHHRWVMAAARAGKHVLVDKPFAVDAAEAVEMVDVCRQAGVQLIEGFMYRYDPRHARLRELVADGSIGDLRQINTAFSFPITPQPGQRAALDRTGRRGAGRPGDLLREREPPAHGRRAAAADGADDGRPGVWRGL